jgi:hypothetical protein
MQLQQCRQQQHVLSAVAQYDDLIKFSVVSKCFHQGRLTFRAPDGPGDIHHANCGTQQHLGCFGTLYQGFAMVPCCFVVTGKPLIQCVTMVPCCFVVTGKPLIQCAKASQMLLCATNSTYQYVAGQRAGCCHCVAHRSPAAASTQSTKQKYVVLPELRALCAVLCIYAVCVLSASCDSMAATIAGCMRYGSFDRAS